MKKKRLVATTDGHISVISGLDARSAEVKIGDIFTVTDETSNPYHYFGHLDIRGSKFHESPGLSGKVVDETRLYGTSRVVFGVAKDMVDSDKKSDYFASFKTSAAFAGGKGMAKEIKNQYEDKYPAQVWNEWKKEQREHFLKDHKEQLGVFYDESFRFISNEWEKIPREVKDEVFLHTNEGQYAGGKGIEKEIKNQYEGKLAGDIWDAWTDKQREHFFYDHQDIVEIGFLHKKYIDLNLHTQKIIRQHIEMGQYAGGGIAEYGTIRPRQMKEREWYNITLPSKEKFKGLYVDKGDFNKNTPTAYIFQLSDNYSDRKSVLIAYLNQKFPYNAIITKSQKQDWTKEPINEDIVGSMAGGSSAHHGGGYAGGRGIPDNYEGKTAEQVWDAWSEAQRWHFAKDHELTDNVSTKTLKMNSSELKKDDWGKEFRHQTSWDWISGILEEHIKEGSYAGGGSAHHGKGGGTNYENEEIDGYYVKNNLTPNQLNKYVKFRGEGAFKKQALEMALTTQKERENFAAGGAIEKLKRAIASSKTSPADRDKMREALHKLQLPTPPPKPKPTKVEKKVKPIELPHLQFLTENKIDVKSLPLKTRQKINGIKMLAGKKSDKARDKAKSLSEALIKSIKAGMKPSNKLNDRKKEEIREGYERRRKAKKAMAD